MIPSPRDTPLKAEWKLIAAIALGGAVGSVARFGLTAFVQARIAGPFPWGTPVVNVLGSFLMGLIVQIGLDATAMSPAVRLLLTTGFCGGFTTFSAFAFDAVKLAGDRHSALAGVYVVGSIGASLVAMLLGMRLARA